MSVINQVLRDLERRHARGNTMPGMTGGSVRAVLRGDAADRGRWRFALLGLGLAAAASAAVYAWQTGLLGAPAARPIAIAPAVAHPAPGPTPVAPPAPPPVAVVLPAVVPPAVVVSLAAEPAVSVALKPAQMSPPTAAVPVAPVPALPAALARAMVKPVVLRAGTADSPGTAVVAPATSPAGGTATAIDKRDLPPTAAARAEVRFRQGAQQLQQGRAHDAEASFLAALAEDPGHVASRQTLLGLYLEARRNDDAEALARDALHATPRLASFAMVLARLQAGRGDTAAAVQTLQESLDVGRGRGDYLAMLAALLQRLGRHGEAADHYQAAIGLGNARPAWFMGQGISLREVGHREEARAAFQSALDSGGLAPELRGFVERQLVALHTGAPN